MQVEIYCDESRLDTLHSEKATRPPYFLLGSIWIPRSERKGMKAAIQELRRLHGVNREIKWKKTSLHKLQFYLALVDLFFNTRQMQFRCLVAARDEMDIEQFHGGDAELAYYKLYYELITHWIVHKQSYRIFLDWRTNRNSYRINDLQAILQRAHPGEEIQRLQFLPSREVALIQLTDLLLGAVASHYCMSHSSPAKRAIIERIEKWIGHPITSTGWGERKFNVFHIKFRGGAE